MSHKNTLQEFCQKNKRAFPEYNTYRIGGKDNMPLWRCKIRFDNKEWLSNPFNNKASAEADAAKKVLDDIWNNFSEKKSKTEVTKPEKKIHKKIKLGKFEFDPDDDSDLAETPSEDEKEEKEGNKLLFELDFRKYKKIVLIDIENKPQLIDGGEHGDRNDILFIGVIGHCHAMAEKETKIFKYIIDDATKDAADHALTFIAGKISDKIKGKKVYIVSGDHYAQITAKCLQNCGIDCQHIAQISQLSAVLE